MVQDNVDCDGYTDGTNYGVYVAINGYSKRMEDELDMSPGDKIKVIADDQEYNDGWYYGCNLNTGYEGLYPKLFTKEICIGREGTMYSKFTKPSSELCDQKERIEENLESGFEVKTTMNDIDKVLAELQGESLDVEKMGSKHGLVSADTTLNNLEQLSRCSSGDDVLTTKKVGVAGLDPVEALTWTPQHVALHMRIAGFDEVHASKFQEHKISGAILLELDLAHLKELDINSFGTRFELFKEIEQIKKAVSRGGNRSHKAQSGQRQQKTSSTGSEGSTVSAASLIVGNIQAVPQEGKISDISNSSTKEEFSTPSDGLYGSVTYMRDSDPIKKSSLDIKNASSGISKTEVTQGKAASTMSSEKKSNVKSEITSQLLMQKALAHNEELSLKSINDSQKLNSHLQDTPPILRYYSNTPRLRTSMPVTFEDDPKDLSFISPQRVPVPSPHLSSVQQPHTVYTNFTENALSLTNLIDSNTSKSQPTTEVRPLERYNTPEIHNPYTSIDLSLSEPVNSRKVIMDFQSNVSHSHRKSKSGGSFVELFNRISMLSSPKDNIFTPVSTPDMLQGGERPTSSIYTHSRHTSGNNQNLRFNISRKDSKKNHRRNSSIFSFLTKDKDTISTYSQGLHPSQRLLRHGSLSDLGYKSHRNDLDEHPDDRECSDTSALVDTNELFSSINAYDGSILAGEEDSKPKGYIKKKDEQRRSVSAKEQRSPMVTYFDARDELSRKNSSATDKSIKESKRSISDAVKSMIRLNSNKGISKKQTSAFTEGIRNVSVNDSMKDADISGWMSKKGAGAMGVWKNRFFTLHGTRLSYFASIDDGRERGLIDITSHRVLPAKEDDKFVALFAATVGKGRYCFKLLPPAPGSKKGLTFTQPKIHYFAVETREEMRNWMATLMKATIDIDTTVPVVSSCATPTVSLSRAQELFSQALEESYKRDENIKNQEDYEELCWEQHHQQNGDDGWNQGFFNFSSTNANSENVNSSVTTSERSMNDNKQPYQIPIATPYMDLDSPADSTITAKNSQYCFNFEQPNSLNKKIGDYFGLDPKYMGQKI